MVEEWKIVAPTRQRVAETVVVREVVGHRKAVWQAAPIHVKISRPRAFVFLTRPFSDRFEAFDRFVATLYCTFQKGLYSDDLHGTFSSCRNSFSRLDNRPHTSVFRPLVGQV